MKINGRTVFWVLITLLLLQLYWRACIFDNDAVSFHFRMKVNSDKTVYAVGDSIAVSVDIIARDSQGVLRLYDNNSNVQVEMRKVENGAFSKDSGSLRTIRYEDMPRSTTLGWNKHQLKAGEKLTLRIPGVISQGENNTIVYDFGVHGKCVSSYTEELGLAVQVHEIFPDRSWSALGSSYIAPTSNFTFFRIMR